MKVYHGLAVSLVVCALVGIGALAYSGVNGARRNVDKGGKGVQPGIDNAQDKSEHPVLYTITASADLGGSISPSGNTSVPRGASQIFIATANTGYRVMDMLVDGQSVGAPSDLYHDDSSTYTFTDVIENHLISATFAVNE